MNNLFLIQTIKRNLRELKDANFMLIVLDQLAKTNTLHPLNFFSIASVALYNDIFSHLCKIYEINGRGKSFWFIENKLRNEVHDIANNQSISIEKLKDISLRLKVIRNKTHFHIDTPNPNKPQSVWKESNIKNYEVRELIEFGYTILNKIYKQISGKNYTISDYNGDDVKDIITSYVKIYPDNGIIY